MNIAQLGNTNSFCADHNLMEHQATTPSNGGLIPLGASPQLGFTTYFNVT